MSSTYAWVIDVDHMADEPGKPGSGQVGNDAGTTGPSNAAPKLLARLAAGEGVEWQLRDGDGELDYTGRLVGADPWDAEEEIAFAPLDDWGTAQGCASLAYKRGAVFVEI
jgi:hypothetical protein